MSRPLLLAALVVAVPLLSYPILVLAQGSPHFPTRAECERPATEDAPDLDVVYGRLDDPTTAEMLLDDITRAGFIGAKLEICACGRWKVFYDPIESVAQGEALAAQVRAAGFQAVVELGAGA